MTICIFAKEPVPGRVKTRLAATVGAAAAARLAAAFLNDTLSLVRTFDVRAVVAWSGALERAPRGVEVWPQGKGDLGARIERMFFRALSRSPWTIALGADSPGLPAEYLRAAIEVLRTSDAVVGPALDGGYYLVGVSRCEPGLLADIAWSVASTRAQTVERLVAHGYRVATVGGWFDVDDASDLARLTRLLREGVVCAEETARELGVLGAAPELLGPRSSE
ncbi:MAG: TIGR04282 family arsenosugar biosynthesis glycosyltransferase [Myxococcota bacterium]|nr:TIGR04282 family arsenosugar biosynthesis glycosyltransferase [Myxococcota bacterium]